ncbi:beta-ketoacyl synthase N-terminal-like domain-containing protein [Undibacterium sp. Ren11W]|uniref:beta-ketoacyl synthase N-terminal-like domain-containing protein n=1 Tax=Undibacterium sp. Ren11W TaxID=3413045 RepID=UPI003BF1B020
MNSSISITAIASLSPLGNSAVTVWENYLSNATCIRSRDVQGQAFFQASIPEHLRAEIAQVRNSHPHYLTLDETVIYAILVARLAIQQAGWNSIDEVGINLGSSRGATQLFEQYHQDFLNNASTPKLCSPNTTLGNISSWVAHDLKIQGPQVSHSVTCSTGLHAVLNGVAWLRAGMSTKFLVGASEAPLTAFTLHQMQALKITARAASADGNYPCRALDFDKQENTMVLGEGAAVACLEPGIVPHALAIIEGVGYASDDARYNFSLSESAICFQKSMKMAMGSIGPDEIDCIILHAPGTILGDSAEFKAIQAVFGTHLPMLTTNKWKIGHSLGASGMLSLELAILMLQHQQFIPVPFIPEQKRRSDMNKILINAVGFGGNAVTILLSKVSLE